MKKILLTFLSLSTLLIGKAQIVDQFNYSGSLVSNGWTHHSGATSGELVTSAGSLTYPGLPSSIGNKATLVAGNAEDINIALTGITNVGYYSFILNVPNTTGLTTTGDYFTGFGGTAGTSVSPLASRLFIKAGATAGTFQLGIQNITGGSPTQTYDATEYPIGTPVFVVVKLDISVSPINASFFVNPVPGSAEPAATASNNSGTATSMTTFGSIFLRQSGNATAGTGNLEIDEIRAGGTWAEVTPAGCSTSSNITTTSCGPYTLNSTTYNTSGSYTQVLAGANAAGCDSTIYLDLTVLNNTTNTISPTACGSYTVPSGDETYTASGTYMDTIQNAAGCDSLLTINLTISSSITYYLDSDSDGFGDPSNTQTGCAPIPGYVTNGDDCDDNNSSIGAPTVMYYTDADNDGYGDASTGALACSQPGGTVTNGDDCDDNNNTIGVASSWYVDSDTDGYGDASGTAVLSCTPVAGSVTNNTDCDDSNSAIHPGAAEIPDNSIDEDCNGSDLSTSVGIYTFNGTVDCATQVLSASGVAANLTFSDFSASDSVTCAAAGNVFNNSGWNTGTTVDLTEYAEFTIYPDNCYALDLTNLSFQHRTSGTGGNPTVHVRSSLDDFAADIFTATIVNPNTYESVSNPLSITGVTDSITFRFYVTNIGSGTATYRFDNVGVNGAVSVLPMVTYYADSDNDGYGNPAITVSDCTQPSGYVLDNTDCNDANANEFPGAVWYADTDNDGFGDAGNTLTQCTQPVGYITDDSDCNDNDNQVGSMIMYYADADNDGYGDASDMGTASCTPISGAVTNADDCDDSDASVNPAATEICDGTDNNCDGNIDEGLTIVTYYQDSDNDGYGNPNVSAADCAQPTGFVADNTDCDDTNNAINPGANDTSGNGVDENCDGVDGSLGLNELDEALLNVFPNPGSDAVTIQVKGLDGKITVTVISAEGKTVISHVSSLENGTTTLATSDLMSGVYVIRVSSATDSAIVRWIKK